MPSKFWNFFKTFDFFKRPVSLMLHRRNREDNSKAHFYEMGTKLGGVSTVFLYVGILSYFIALWVDMYSGGKDIISKQFMNNNFNPGFDNITIPDYHFLPSIELTNMDTSGDLNIFGIMDNFGNIDIKQMAKYARIVLNIKELYSDYKHNNIYEFRNCNADDFKQAGITDEVKIKKLSMYRLCPDIAYDDPIYRVQNSYTDETYRHSFSMEMWPCNPDLSDECASE